MKLQLRELKAARSTISSQGLGPRQSVLPLLISFLFSHIAELSFLSPPSSTRSPPIYLPAVLSLPIVLFFLFFLFSVSPSHLSRGFSLSPTCLISQRGNPRVRFTARERKCLFSFLARCVLSLLSHFHDRFCSVNLLVVLFACKVK